MPKDEWGVKRICPSCTNRFYDLRHDPMTCPNCGTTFTLDSLTVARGKVVRAEKVKPEVVDIEDIPDIETDDEVIESDDELDDDILEDEEDNVDLEEIADVAGEEDEA